MSPTRREAVFHTWRLGLVGIGILLLLREGAYAADGVLCPTGWTLTAANTCLRRGNAVLTWQAAQSYCQNTIVGGIGGNLVSISSGSQNTAVATVCGADQRCWIGLNDIATEGVYVWADGAPFIWGSNGGDDDFPTPPWTPGEPNNFVNEDCVRIEVVSANGRLQGRWNDENCNISVYFPVCEAGPLPVRCPDGWTLTTANTCLWRVTTLARWPDAQSACRSSMVGGAVGDLVSITSSAENDAVAAVCGAGNSCWTGLNDRGHEGTFSWSDGTPFTYGNRVSGGSFPNPPWVANQPDNFGAGQNCVRLIDTTLGGQLTGVWDDEDCADRYFYICETATLAGPPSPPPPPPPPPPTGIASCPKNPSDRCNWESSGDSFLVLQSGGESLKVIMNNLGTSKADYNGANGASPLTDQVDYLLCFYSDNDSDGQLSQVAATARLIPGGVGSWREWPTGYKQDNNPNSPPTTIVMNPGQLVIKGGEFSNMNDELAPKFYAVGASRAQAQLFKLEADGSFVDEDAECFDTGVLTRVSSPDPSRFSANSK